MIRCAIGDLINLRVGGSCVVSRGLLDGQNDIVFEPDQATSSSVLSFPSLARNQPPLFTVDLIAIQIACFSV